MKYILSLTFVIFLMTGCEMNNKEKIDKIFTDYDNANLPGATVMVLENGESVFIKGYGLADLENNKPITTQTNFRLASVTKQFTAMSILMLIDRGELSFTSTLNNIFPNFPEYGNSITIKNLLQHTSGLIDYEDLIEDSVTVQVKDKDVLNMILQTDSTYFVPGSQHKYSNTGYALLALTVEKISDKPFREFLKDNIFTPLAMNNTIAFEKNINEVKNRAYGYTVSGKETKFTDQSVTSAVLGDGGIYSSLNDLFKWDQALYTDKLINRKLMDEAWTKGKTNAGEEFPYGYGWRLETYNDSKVVYHTGSTRGFRNIIYRIPDKRFTVVILTNRNAESEFITLDLAHRMVEIYFPPQ